MSVRTLNPVVLTDRASAQSALFVPPRQSGSPKVMVETLTRVEKTVVELSAQLNTRHWVVVFTQDMYMTSLAPWPGTRIRCPPAFVKLTELMGVAAQAAI